ncbi:MAG TPA: phenylalanine--tRNA ligase beta subunit-related protein [Anaerolineae bacterium]|nr:phenylalanine--tRNA ligase beta subunit-related protein [Anaerolineae bacterium]HMR66057.1 phenylalanine--tRNA ligase beta subunit-related protein [Anaerolineae bacterium]
MHFLHAPQIWQDYPQLVPGLLFVENVHPNVRVDDQLQPLFDRARQRMRETTESQLAEIVAWRRAFSQMGLKPTQYRSAGEALLRRFRKEDDLPRLHPLVDLCNAVSLAFALPVAVFDLAQVDSFLEVRYATGVEQYLAFNDEVETPPAGEVIFVDAGNQVHARRWTFRQSRRSVIGTETRQALIVSEALHETGAGDMKALMKSLVANLAQVWDVPKKQVILTAESPRFDL